MPRPEKPFEYTFSDIQELTKRPMQSLYGDRRDRSESGYFLYDDLRRNILYIIAWATPEYMAEINDALLQYESNALKKKRRTIAKKTPAKSKKRTAK